MFGKVQVLVRFNEKVESPAAGSSQERLPCLLEYISKESCFVQFFDILPHEHLTVDVVDKALNCVRAKQERKEDLVMVLAASKSFRLLPVDIIRRKVHTVRADVGTFLLQ